ncbi:hypothetical protein AOC36_10585 [Erysipelothrix larvae]|uniref:LemA family protein n=1 Tax=Erysipelothrix larvae TaxID=1514105 RepID=A0A0X8H1P7_9FIRM|nr:LemA family protein [Erysipelothrix larvae]AMC94401.1 hypothetical protein AOC36_10585 [Erysipelothrix larvae]
MERYIIGAILFALAIYVLVMYNSLVKRRNMVENQKSQIDVELQRRFDLIPNLVEVVKGYAGYEKNTLEDVISARNNYIHTKDNTSDALQSNASLSGALSRLFALSESYPDLKANKNFLDLQSELSNTEKKIAYSRQFYNDSVYRLNNKIDMFPSNIVATLFRFKKEAFFETTDSQRANVNVTL